MALKSGLPMRILNLIYTKGYWKYYNEFNKFIMELFIPEITVFK